MNYKQRLIKKIKDPDKWPAFERPDFLAVLNTIADEAFQRSTIEGYLAALLIYHQICEELIRLIIKNAQFYIQLAVFPAEIEFPEKKRVTFGQLIDELKSTLSFQNKGEFIEKCSELNKYRVDVVHRLTKKTTLQDVQRQMSEAKNLFAEISDRFMSINDFFRGCFGDFRDDFEDYSEDEYSKH